ncbi:MAG: ATP-binding protein [Fibromonadales bacterium]|nr:ATP-binding protein [Fibromonadales bacterium]
MAGVIRKKVRKMNFARFLEDSDERSYTRYSSPTKALRESKCAKYFEYLLSMHKTHYDFSLRDEHYVEIIDFLGTDGLNRVIEITGNHLKNNSEQSKSRNQFETKLGKALHAPDFLASWLMINELLNSKFWLSEVKNPFDVNFLFLEMLKYALDMQIKAKLLYFSDVFEERLGILSETLDLDRVSQDVLTLTFATSKDSLMDDLSDCVMETFKGRHSSSNFLDRVISILTGHSRDSIMNSLSKPRGLIELGILDEDGDLPPDVKNFLSGIGSGNFLENYARIDSKKALPVERFDCVKEASLICDLIKSYKNNRSLNFLFYGMEGTGKSELARSIAAETGKTLYEIGAEFKNNQGIFGKQTHKEGVISYRVRALKISEICLREKDVLLVADEADLILNGFEKGILNRFLENLKLPVIWITNNINNIERSTMRRFQYSVSFDLGNQNIRKKLWDSVVEKHKAEQIFSPERRKKLAEKYEISTGGIELAVQNEVALMESGMHKEIGEEILENHVELMGLKTNKHTVSRAPKYDVSVLNIPNLNEVLHSAKCYSEQLKSKHSEGNMTMLLYGPPGTGKTEFAKFLARECGLSFREISYGQISSMWVGETEKQLAAAFKQANESGELLFIDEADSLIADRKGAVRSWEVTQTNEFLVQLESAKCMVVCSTNFQGHLDIASNRRFHFHLHFGFLKREGILKMAENFFPDFFDENWEKIAEMDAVAPGDFYAVYKRLQWLPKDELTAKRVIQELEGMVAAKEPYGSRKIGF